MSGRVFNDGPVRCRRRYVNAASIDASGKVVAQGIPFVGSVAARAATPSKRACRSVAGARATAWAQQLSLGMGTQRVTLISSGRGIIRSSVERVGSPPERGG